jgi:hypothetical protein
VQEPVGEKEISAWAERHDIQGTPTDLRSMFEDAASFTTPPAQPAGRPTTATRCSGCDLVNGCPEFCKCNVAQPAPVPLTLAKIRAMWGSENGLEDCDLCKFDDFVQVVRFIESASGITEKGQP